MDTIIASIIGTVGTGFFLFLGWSVNRLINSLDAIRREQQVQHDRQAVLRHLLTQVVLRVEGLEDRERDRER